MWTARALAKGLWGWGALQTSASSGQPGSPRACTVCGRPLHSVYLERLSRSPWFQVKVSSFLLSFHHPHFLKRLRFYCVIFLNLSKSQSRTFMCGLVTVLWG